MKIIICIVLFYSYSFIGFGQTLVPYLGKAGYGFCTPEGKVIIDSKYDEVSFFDDNGFANTRKDSLWILIDKEGNEYNELQSKVKLIVSKINNVQSDESYRHRQDIPMNYLTQIYAVKKENSYKYFWLLSKAKKRMTGPFLTEYIEDSHVTFGYYFGGDGTTPVYLKNHLTTLSDKMKQSLFDTLGNLLLQNINEIRILNKNFVCYDDKMKDILFDTHAKKNLILGFGSIQKTLNDSCFLATNKKERLFGEPKIHLDTNDYINIINLQGRTLFSDTLRLIETLTSKHYLAYQNENSSLLIKVDNDKTEIKKYNYIYKINDNRLAVKKGSKLVQVIDYEGNLIFDSPYDNVYGRSHSYSNNYEYYIFSKENRSGIMDLNFNHLFEFEADRVERTDLPNYYLFKKGDLTGVVYQNGNVIIPAEYAEIDVLYQTDYFQVRVGNPHHQESRNLGLFTKEGKKILDPIYDEIRKYDHKGKVYFSAKLNDKIKIFDENGSKICDVEQPKYWYGISEQPINIEQFNKPDSSFLYDRFGRFIRKTNSHCYLQKLINKVDDSTFYLLTEDNKNYQLIDDEGNNFLEKNQRFVRYWASREYTYGLFPVEENGLEGVINHQKEIILPFDNQEIVEINKYYIIVNKNKKVNIYSHKGERLNPQSYTNIELYQYGSLRYVSRELANTICQDSTYNHTTNRYDVFNVNCKEYGFIDTLGKLIIPFQYHSIKDNNHYFACATKGLIDGKKQSFVLDPIGKEVLKTQYDELKMINDYYDKDTHENPYFIAKKANKYGIIDLKGNIIVPLKYKALSSYWKKILFRAKYQNQEVIINVRGEVIANGSDLKQDLEIMVGRDLSRVCNIDKIYLLRLKDKTLIIDENGSVKFNIVATKIQQYFKDPYQYLNSFPKRKNDLELKLLKIEKDNKIWYFNFEKFIEYKK